MLEKDWICNMQEPLSRLSLVVMVMWEGAVVMWYVTVLSKAQTYCSLTGERREAELRIDVFSLTVSFCLLSINIGLHYHLMSNHFKPLFPLNAFNKTHLRDSACFFYNHQRVIQRYWTRSPLSNKGSGLLHIMCDNCLGHSRHFELSLN